uniref:PHD-type domain-containing protein n=1 Tax=Peronospora matthiolae TaxID=2874970 RepID=A0AAV1T2Q6_9STRA
MSRAATPLNADACRVCGKEDDEEFLVLCDGCDRAFHTACHQGCTCCMTKPRNNFARKPAVPEGDWFCKFCAGRIPALDKGKPPVSSIFVWGDNEDGQLGLPDTEAKVVWQPTKVHELDGIGVLDIACSETSTFVLGNDTNLYSVGTGLCGQLGHQDVVHERLPHFRLLESMTEDKRSKGEGRFAQIHAGAHFGVVVTTAGHAYTWGNGEHGQLGHQENKNKKVPKKVSALRELEVPVDLTACGSDFVIMTTKDPGDDDQFNTNRPGVFMSMGSNTQAQLGDASNKNQWVPQLLNNDAPDVTSSENADIEEPAEFLLGRDITQLAAGGSHAVAVVAGTNGIWTWGYGDRGQVGHEKSASPPGESKFFRSQFRVPRPRFVQAFRNDQVTSVACGAQHTLVLLQDGRLFAMGDNEFGQLGTKRGDEAETNCTSTPVRVTTFGSDKNLKQIGCGHDFSMTLTTTGEVYSWGRNQLGQLGLGDSQPGSLDTPTKVSELPRIQKLAIGVNQVFAIEFTDVTLPPPIVRVALPAKRSRPSGIGANRSKKSRT